MLNILFGLNRGANKKAENQILELYTEVTGERFEFESEYYLGGIEKALNEKDFDVLIIREDLEEIQYQ